MSWHVGNHSKRCNWWIEEGSHLWNSTCATLIQPGQKTKKLRCSLASGENSNNKTCNRVWIVRREFANSILEQSHERMWSLPCPGIWKFIERHIGEQKRQPIFGTPHVSFSIS